MPTSAPSVYLTTEVMTATPQKLRLMLIDAALRFGKQAREGWRTQADGAASQSLVRCQEIVKELLASLGCAKNDLSRKMAGVYIYLFRTLTEAHLQRDAKKLDNALRVLEIERETWRLVCDKLGAQSRPTANSDAGISCQA